MSESLAVLPPSLMLRKKLWEELTDKNVVQGSGLGKRRASDWENGIHLQRLKMWL
jgi:hypothetical protein